MTTPLAIDIALMVVLFGLGGLLLMLHQRIRDLATQAQQMPMLSEQLNEALNRTREALRLLAEAARTEGARLEDKTLLANRTLQDFDFVLDRAEKVLRRFDERPSLTTAAAPEIPVTRPKPAPAMPDVLARSSEVQPEPRPVAKPQPQPTDGRPLTGAAALAAVAAARQRVRREEPLSKPAAEQLLAPRPARTAPAVAPTVAKAAPAKPAPAVPTAVAPAATPTARPVKPASPSLGAAAYSAAATRPVVDEEKPTAKAAPRRQPLTDAERDLRRALEEAL
jgi:hypothetical protein